MSEEERMVLRYYWQKVVGEETLRMDLEVLKKSCSVVFRREPDNYKQKLVYNLLDAIRNNDQKEFFYILLKAINKPKEDFKMLWRVLEESYDVMPEEVFVNFAYTVVIGIMATYRGEKNE
ncbi:MAG: hypothetical protein QXU48_05840 [Thermoplasmata archaeon]